MQGLRENLAIHLVGVLIVEWWQASQHLVQENAEGPPIDRLGVAAASEEFWGKILGRTTESC